MTADPLLRTLLAELDATRQALAQAVAAVPPARRELQPTPGRWSVAEVLAHLVIVETRSARAIAGLAAAAPARDGAPMREDAEHGLDMTRLLDRTRKVNAAEVLHPTAPLDAAEAWAALEAARKALHDAIVAADGRDLSVVHATHPVLGVLDGYQFIAAIGGHETRHTAQIREIAAELDAREE